MNEVQKIPVGVLGATGSVGQKFISVLSGHPYFVIAAVCASERSAGRTYREAVNWYLPERIPEAVADMTVLPVRPDLPCRVVFSGLDAKVAGDAETDFADAGYTVISNARNHRYDPGVPLLIPEVNPDHLDILASKDRDKGKIVTNPNCSAIGLVLALKPLYDEFGLEQVNVTTMQAISGAGYPGLSALAVMDNVIPYISGEEEKMEREPLKILGQFTGSAFENADIRISAACNRVAVLDGHTESVQVRLRKKARVSDLIGCWSKFTAEPQKLKLPLAPSQPVHYFEDPSFPQPRLHRNLENGMAVAVGRVRECPIFDFKFTVLSHNTMRGAAGGAVLCAELMHARGMLPA